MTFKIRPDRKETENKTVRFPLDLVTKIEHAIEGKGVTFRDLSFKLVNTPSITWKTVNPKASISSGW